MTSLFNTSALTVFQKNAIEDKNFLFNNQDNVVGSDYHELRGKGFKKRKITNPSFQRRSLADSNHLKYDANLDGNGIIYGKTGCGKTAFIQKCLKNGFLGEIERVFWVCPDSVDDTFVIKNEKGFNDVGVEVSYFFVNDKKSLSSTVAEIVEYLKFLKGDNEEKSARPRRKYDDSDDGDDDDSDEDSVGRNFVKTYGEKISKVKYLAIFDDMTGLGENCESLAHFYTINRKLDCIAYTVFHDFFGESRAMRTMLANSEQKVFFTLDFNSRLKTYLSNLGVHHQKHAARSNNQIWLNSLYFGNIANLQNSHLLISTCRGKTGGPSMFRSNADDGEKQICFYPSTSPSHDKSIYNTFVSERVNNTAKDIKLDSGNNKNFNNSSSPFKITKLIKSTKNGDIYQNSRLSQISFEQSSTDKKIERGVIEEVEENNSITE